MHIRSFALSVLLLALTIAAERANAASPSSSSSSSSSCRDLGFSSSLLASSCSSCDNLDTFSLGFMKSDCLRCCQSEMSSEERIMSAKSGRIHIEVCQCNWARYPDIKDFITQDAVNFPKLEVQYKSGVLPQLVATNSAGQEVDRKPIGAWKRDVLKEYLTTVFS
ncbi:hypothetical protein CAOG_006629 [Capsaspora owczarzaki ATCC 30864]|uniref:Selenoprotein F n=1 Tax=Capsaspora owczarzaki (strain ATCC 30864) TaxID=595528 RepID=A0A0D2UML4_CAPO3|nr:hypothetical protein CAOG_006629 [Capsaspora owczarzaki ATCC 30864]